MRWPLSTLLINMRLDSDYSKSGDSDTVTVLTVLTKAAIYSESSIPISIPRASLISIQAQTAANKSPRANTEPESGPLKSSPMFQ